MLDLGCGTGPNFVPLREALGPEGRVVGIDFSPKMVQQAEERIREHGWMNVEVVCADPSRVRLDPAAYDAAIATASLSAIADMPAAVENVYAAPRTGGRFFVLDLRFVPINRAGLAVRLLGLVYQLLAGQSGLDVLTQLGTTFQSVDLVLPLRPWRLVWLALARKTNDSTARS